MTFISQVFSLLKKAIFESNEYALYRYNPSRQGEGQIDYEIETFIGYRNVPKIVRRQTLQYPLLHPLFYRILSHKAKLLCIKNDKELIAYGWIQSWEPFKRKFGFLATKGVVLGPYWTNPKFRGRGYYGRLLNHSIAILEKSVPIYIYISPDNHASQRGIEKAGFKFIDVYQITLFFRVFEVCKKTGKSKVRIKKKN